MWQDGLFIKMLHKGMNGIVLRIIRSMYESVKSIVQCGRDVSEVICQYVGVRQGCVLSPCLFSLFIADLPKFLSERGGVGVNVKVLVVCG